MTILLQAKNLYKAYGEGGARVSPLQGASLTLYKGEMVAVMGVSGCGKTTLLRILSGLESPDKGEITCDPLLRKSVAFQDARLLPWKTVRENLELALLHGFRLSQEGLKEAIQRVLLMVGLVHVADSYPHTLSGGMAQRVNVARALVNHPDILFLDEPLGALDALTRYQLQGELKQWIKSERTTTLLITHDVIEAVRLADRVIQLKGGQVVKEWCIPKQLSEVEMGAWQAKILQALMVS